MKKSSSLILSIALLATPLISLAQQTTAVVGPSLGDKLELTLIFVAVICGVVAATYFYRSTEIFLNTLKRPLRIISSGMFIMAIGVLLAAFINYESKFGVDFALYHIPLEVFFYCMYIVGSLIILFGARKLVYRPDNY